MSRPDRPEPDERQRASQALELRTAGMTYAAVAAELGYADESGARKAVDRLLSRVEHEGAADLRTIEGRRLDALMAAHWQAAVGGDIDSSKIILQTIDRRAKLFGLNAPQRVQVAPDEVSGAEFAERAARLIAELRPDSLRAAFGTTPGAAAVFDAGSQTPAPEGDCPLEDISAVSGAHGPEIASAAPVDIGSWSNVDAVERVSASQPDFSDIPGEVLAAAAAADSDDAAQAILDRYRRMI